MAVVCISVWGGAGPVPINVEHNDLEVEGCIEALVVGPWGIARDSGALAHHVPVGKRMKLGYVLGLFCLRDGRSYMFRDEMRNSSGCWNSAPTGRVVVSLGVVRMLEGRGGLVNCGSAEMVADKLSITATG